MAHKTLIGGTSYNVAGGKALIDGTSYSIAKGKTLVGGTGYDISFGTPVERFARLMSNAVTYKRAGRDNSSSAEVHAYINPNEFGTYYVFAISRKAIGIHKVVFDAASSWTITNLFTYGTGATNLYASTFLTYPDVYLSSSGSTATSVYGGQIAILTFTGYAEETVDDILSSITGVAVDGATGSRTAVYLEGITADAYCIAGYSQYIGVSCPIGNVVYGDYTSNPSLVYYDTSRTRLYISTNGTSSTATYGATLIQIA